MCVCVCVSARPVGSSDVFFVHRRHFAYLTFRSHFARPVDSLTNFNLLANFWCVVRFFFSLCDYFGAKGEFVSFFKLDILTGVFGPKVCKRMLPS